MAIPQFTIWVFVTWAIYGLTFAIDVGKVLVVGPLIIFGKIGIATILVIKPLWRNLAMHLMLSVAVDIFLFPVEIIILIFGNWK